MPKIQMEGGSPSPSSPARQRYDAFLAELQWRRTWLPSFFEETLSVSPSSGPDSCFPRLLLSSTRPLRWEGLWLHELLGSRVVVFFWVGMCLVMGSLSLHTFTHGGPRDFSFVIWYAGALLSVTTGCALHSRLVWLADDLTPSPLASIRDRWENLFSEKVTKFHRLYTWGVYGLVVIAVEGAMVGSMIAQKELANAAANADYVMIPRVTTAGLLVYFPFLLYSLLYSGFVMILELRSRRYQLQEFVENLPRTLREAKEKHRFLEESLEKTTRFWSPRLVFVLVIALIYFLVGVFHAFLGEEKEFSFGSLSALVVNFLIFALVLLALGDINEFSPRLRRKVAHENPFENLDENTAFLQFLSEQKLAVTLCGLSLTLSEIKALLVTAATSGLVAVLNLTVNLF